MSSIYVCNLPYSVDSDKLSEIFQRYGEVQSAKVITDRDSGRSKGFGFVEMDDHDAETAIMELNGTEISGREIRVSPAKPKTNSGAGYPKRNFVPRNNDY